MVRRVSSGRRLPLGPPLGLSIRPAGPSSANFFFQANRVNLDRPTRAAKSPAGRPLRSQVSSNRSRCSGRSASALPTGLDSDGDRDRVRASGGRLGAASRAPSSASSSAIQPSSSSGSGRPTKPLAGRASGGAGAGSAGSTPLRLRRRSVAPADPAGGADASGPPSAGGAAGDSKGLTNSSDMTNLPFRGRCRYGEEAIHPPNSAEKTARVSGRGTLARGTPHEVLLARGCRSIADGLNAALARAKHRWVVCVHQDVYLPEGWERRL